MKEFFFKQFRVALDENVMPLTADAVVFGCWVDIIGKFSVLDIGSGSGILSLLLAQRNPQTRIHSIDKSEDAVRLTGNNVNQSPFKNRITTELADILKFKSEMLFDALVFNPPFHIDGIPSNKEKIATSKHTDIDFLYKFLIKARDLTNENGKLNLLISYVNTDEVIRLARKSGWELTRITRIKGKNGKIRRVMLEWGKTENRNLQDSIDMSPDISLIDDKAYRDLVAGTYVNTKK